MATNPVEQYMASREAYYKAHGTQPAGAQIGRTAGAGEVFLESAKEGVSLGHYQSDLGASSRKLHPVSQFSGQLAGGLIPVVVGGAAASATGPFAPLTMQALGAGLGAARAAESEEQRAENVLTETGLFTMFEGLPRVRMGRTPLRQLGAETAAIGAGATGVELAHGASPEEAALGGGIMSLAHGTLRGPRAFRQGRTEAPPAQPEPVRTPEGVTPEMRGPTGADIRRAAETGETVVDLRDTRRMMIERQMDRLESQELGDQAISNLQRDIGGGTPPPEPPAGGGGGGGVGTDLRRFTRQNVLGQQYRGLGQRAEGVAPQPMREPTPNVVDVPPREVPPSPAERTARFEEAAERVAQQPRRAISPENVVLPRRGNVIEFDPNVRSEQRPLGQIRPQEPPAAPAAEPVRPRPVAPRGGGAVERPQYGDQNYPYRSEAEARAAIEANTVPADLSKLRPTEPAEVPTERAQAAPAARTPQTRPEAPAAGERAATGEIAKPEPAAPAATPRRMGEAREGAAGRGKAPLEYKSVDALMKSLRDPDKTPGGRSAFKATQESNMTKLGRYISGNRLRGTQGVGEKIEGLPEGVSKTHREYRRYSDINMADEVYHIPRKPGGDLYYETTSLKGKPEVYRVEFTEGLDKAISKARSEASKINWRVSIGESFEQVEPTNLRATAKKIRKPGSTSLDMFAGSKLEDVLPSLEQPARAAYKTLDAGIKKALAAAKINAVNFGRRLAEYVTGTWDKLTTAMRSALEKAHTYLQSKGFYDTIKLQNRKGAIKVPPKKGREAEAQARREAQFRERTRPPEPGEPIAENMSMISDKQLMQIARRMGTKVSWKQMREASQEYFGAEIESLSMPEASALVRHLKGGRPPMYKQVREVHDSFMEKGFTHQEIHDAAVLKFGVESLTSMRPEDAPILREHMQAKYEAKQAAARTPDETLTKAQQAADAVKKGAEGVSRWYTDHLREARARIMRTVTGKAEALKMDRAHRFGQEMLVDARYKWDSTLREINLNRRERDWLRENWKSYVESGGKTGQDGAALPTDVSRGKLETMRESWIEIRDMYANAAKELEIKGFHPVEGEYFPHWLTPEAKEALYYGEGPVYEALFEAAKLKPWAQYGGWAKFRSRLREGRFGSLEEPRLADLPEYVTVKGKRVKVLKTDPFDVVPYYTKAGARRLGFIREYGQGKQAEAHMNAAMDAIRTESQRMGRSGEADAGFYKNVMEELQGIDKNPPPRGAGKLLFAGQNIARANHLTMAQITNFVLGPVPAATRFGAANTFKTILRTITDAEYRENLRQHGAWMYDAWSGMKDTSDFIGKTGKVSRKVLKYTGFEFANRFVNMVAGGAALEHFSTALRKGNRAALKVLQREYGFTEAEITEALARGEFTRSQRVAIAERAKALTNVTDMSALDTQPWAKTPVAKFMLAYMSPIMKLGDTLALAVDQARGGNWTPLVTHLAGGVIAADLNRRIKDWLRMKDREDETFLGRLYVDMLYGGALGMPGEFAQRLYFAKKYDQSVFTAPMPEFFQEFYSEFPELHKAFLRNNPAANAFAIRTGLVEK